MSLRLSEDRYDVMSKRYTSLKRSKRKQKRRNILSGIGIGVGGLALGYGFGRVKS
jgi:hypothetical protein